MADTQEIKQEKAAPPDPVQVINTLHEHIATIAKQRDEATAWLTNSIRRISYWVEHSSEARNELDRHGRHGLGQAILREDWRYDN